MNQNSASTILKSNDKILLLRRSMKTKWNPGLWGLPGGKKEPGETLEACARRELLEETQIKYEGPLKTHTTKFSDYERLVFVAEINHSDIDVSLNTEHTDYRWVSTDDLGEYYLVPGLLETVRQLEKNEE
jgi:8-oxo-dGTP diphosphatase